MQKTITWSEGKNPQQTIKQHMHIEFTADFMVSPKRYNLEIFLLVRQSSDYL